MAKMNGPANDKREGYADGIGDGNKQPGRSPTYNANFKNGRADLKKSK